MRGTQTHLRKSKVDAAFNGGAVIQGSAATVGLAPPLCGALVAAGWVPDIGFVRILTILNCILVNLVVAKLSAVWSIFSKCGAGCGFANAIQT